MRRRSSYLSTGCLLLTLGLTGPLGFATVLYSLVDPAGALGVMVSANVYLAIPVLIAWGICRVVRAARAALHCSPTPGDTTPSRDRGASQITQDTQGAWGDDQASTHARLLGPRRRRLGRRARQRPF